MQGAAKVFFEKDGKRTEVGVKKAVGKGGPRFWFRVINPESQQLPKERTTNQSPKRRSRNPPRKKRSR